MEKLIQQDGHAVVILAIFCWKDSRWKERQKERQLSGILPFHRIKILGERISFPRKNFFRGDLDRLHGR
jgi:hypothetical protein